MPFVGHPTHTPTTTTTTKPIRHGRQPATNRGEATRNGRWIPEPAFKKAIDQARFLCAAAATFATIEGLPHFIDTLVARRNKQPVAGRSGGPDAFDASAAAAHPPTHRDRGAITRTGGVPDQGYSSTARRSQLIGQTSARPTSTRPLEAFWVGTLVVDPSSGRGRNNGQARPCHQLSPCHPRPARKTAGPCGVRSTADSLVPPPNIAELKVLQRDLPRRDACRRHGRLLFMP